MTTSHQEMNPQQLEAVHHIEGALLVLAGAGSGKTRVVTQRIVHMLEQGIHPDKILAVTFTNKAAEEMRHRVQTLTHARILVSTFHSLGARILRESISHLGYRPGFGIYDEDDVEKVLRAITKKLEYPAAKSDIKALRGMISKAKNNLHSHNELQDYDGKPEHMELLPHVYRMYIEKLEEYNAVDFDDLLYLPVRLFREHEEVLKYYQDRWHYMLIDEYQDTNGAQYELVNLLVSERGNLCVVGDPDQSIYSWRGAQVRNILEFQSDYPSAKTVRLEQNYRSTNTILEASNALISQNSGRLEKALWSDKGAGAKIGIYEGADEVSETYFVTERLRHHHEQEGIPYNEMVIFYRTNFQSRAFEDRLLSAGIPYVIVGGLSFYLRREIKDILAYLRLVHSSDDGVAFERTVNLPKRGIGPTTILKLQQGASALQMPIFEFCQGLLGGSISTPKLSPRQRKGLTDFVNLIEGLKRLRSQVPLKDLVKSAINLTGYLDFLRSDPETYEDRSANLEELVSKAAERDKENLEDPLSQFLEELTLKSTIDDIDDDIPRLNLMTLHSGKGLEFPVAFLVGMEEDLFPHINSRNSEAAVEEERRLCYVGMTRAKEQLYISHVRQRMVWGTTRRMYSSRFLKDIPSQYTARVSAQRSQSPTRKASKPSQSLPAGFEHRASQHNEAFKEGDVVFHPQLGIGTIKELYQGSAGLTYKVIFAKESEPRSLVAKIAPLSKL